jgi:hypothetical protein
MIISGIGMAALLIIGYFWCQKRRYTRLLEILTNQIDKIPVQDQYDKLTKRINDQTKTKNLEPLLRSTLKRQGINI